MYADLNADPHTPSTLRTYGIRTYVPKRRRLNASLLTTRLAREQRYVEQRYMYMCMCMCMYVEQRE